MNYKRHTYKIEENWWDNATKLTEFIMLHNSMQESNMQLNDKNQKLKCCLRINVLQLHAVIFYITRYLEFFKVFDEFI